MNKRNILKILIITTVATFTVITHNKAIQQQKEIRLQKAMNFKYKTEKQRYDNLIKSQKEAKELAEQKKQEELKKIKEQENLSRGKNIEERTFILTFYTSLDCENGYGAITCEGKRLRDGIVANNVLPLHTKINLIGYGDVEVADRGGNNFNTEERLDVYVPREHGENDYHYKKRVNNMGRVKVKGFIIK